MAAVSHAQARKIVLDAWRLAHGRDATPNEALYTQAIALLETGYGRAGQFAALAAQGKFNWGALERRPSADGSCPAGTMPGSDQGSVCFLVFPSDAAAAAAFISNLTKRHWPTIEAMKGTAEDVARAMRVQPAYYTGTGGTENQRIQVYATAIRNAMSAISKDVPVAKLGTSTSGSLLPILGLGLGGAALYAWHSSYGWRFPWQRGFRF